MAKTDVIRFSAQVWQIKTLVDGGVNITLALSEKEINQVSKLLECKQRGALLEIAVVPVMVKVDAKQKNEEPKRRKKRYPY